MVTNAVPRAWAFGTLRQRLWMSHVLTAGTWPWRCCAPDTSSLDLGVSPLPCPVLVPLASHSSSTSHRLGFPDECAGSSDRAGPSISFGTKGDKSHGAGPGSDDVHISGPGAPPVADLGGYEGVRQAPLPGLLDLPGRPIRRSGGGFCPTVLRRTEADGGVSSHPAPAVRCCLHPTAGCSPSVCSSPRAPSCF